MLRGPGRCPALTTTLAAAVLALLGASVPLAAASTGGASLTTPPPTGAKLLTPPPLPAPVLVAVHGIPQLTAGLVTRRAFRSSATSAMLAYASHASGRLQVRVDVVRALDGLSVFSDVRVLAPGATQTLRWNGRVHGGLALDGRYEIRIAAAAPGVAAGVLSAAQPPSAGGAAPGVDGVVPQGSPPPDGAASVGAFTFLGAIFPVRGKHDYGEGAARFGAGRAGHTHEGQDVMAKCGTPLVAARGGTVVQRARQSAAGNYLVIHDPASGQDYVYAHLRRPAIVRRGARVETGQPIGVVGETGDATACHLHFELWSAPGWYEGGAPTDPLATLQRWDRVT